MAQKEILLTIYKENADQARQHELFRETITAIVGGVTGAVLSLSLKEATAALESPLLPLAGIFLAIMATFGLIASMKHYERNRLHVERMKGIRKALDALPGMPPNLLSGINATAKTNHGNVFPWLSRVKLNKVWNAFHILIIVLGIGLALLPWLCHYVCRVR